MSDHGVSRRRLLEGPGFNITGREGAAGIGLTGEMVMAPEVSSSPEMNPSENSTGIVRILRGSFSQPERKSVIVSPACRPVIVSLDVAHNRLR